MKIDTFGRMPDGKEVKAFTLTNRHGASAQVLNIGAVVHALVVPDRDGNLQDVVLGCDTVEDYHDRSPFFGAIVGRYGNRISRGRFTLDDKVYSLAVNNGDHHLHGGVLGFHKKFWDIEEMTCESGTAVRASLVSPDREEGYPGTVSLEVVISLDDENTLRLAYRGTSDMPTVLNPTHHGYFNLSGDPSRSILDHELTIDADAYTPVDSGMIPTGEIASVEDTPMDFRKKAAVGSRIDAGFEQLELGNGYDHNYVLNSYLKGELRKVARLAEPGSGRIMDVFTDQPGMQLYSGNFLDGTLRGKSGVAYNRRCGICLEAQHHPDSPNIPHFPSPVLRPGDVYRQVTCYQFSTD